MGEVGERFLAKPPLGYNIGTLLYFSLNSFLWPYIEKAHAAGVGDLFCNVHRRPKKVRRRPKKEFLSVIGSPSFFYVCLRHQVF